MACWKGRQILALMDVLPGIEPQWPSIGGLEYAGR
jgi:hypothetical protein